MQALIYAILFILFIPRMFFNFTKSRSTKISLKEAIASAAVFTFTIIVVQWIAKRYQLFDAFQNSGAAGDPGTGPAGSYNAGAPSDAGDAGAAGDANENANKVKNVSNEFQNLNSKLSKLSCKCDSITNNKLTKIKSSLNNLIKQQTRLQAQAQIQRQGLAQGQMLETKLPMYTGMYVKNPVKVAL